MATIDAFLSYDARDRELVLEVAAGLEASGVTVFVDRWHLTVGLPWQNALEEALRHCRAVLVFVGANGLGPWQQRERDLALLRQATESGFQVIPVLLPRSEPPLDFLALNAWIDLRQGFVVSSLVMVVRDALAGRPTDASNLPDLQLASSDICPYRGLRPFREEDAPFFFGRESISERLENLVKHHSLVGVVGPSGSGKSSVVRAGLIPRLRRHSAGAVYEFAALSPSRYPFLSLAGALASLLDAEASEVQRMREAAGLAELLQNGGASLSRVVSRILRAAAWIRSHAARDRPVGGIAYSM